MTSLDIIRDRSITLMKNTLVMLGHILKNVSQEQAVIVRDGVDGWTVLEIVSHLRDFDHIFYNRAVQMLEEEYPHFTAYDQDAMAIERDYNQQDIIHVYGELVQSRHRMMEFFQSLTPEQWERTGFHPERGHYSMTDQAVQVGTHDVVHLEQITRILAE